MVAVLLEYLDLTSDIYMFTSILTSFAPPAKMNGTQRRNLGKSLKNVLDILRYAKRHLSG